MNKLFSQLVEIKSKYIIFTESMKILYLSPHPNLSIHSPAGYATHMREMINAFEAIGCDVKALIAADLHSSDGFENKSSYSNSRLKIFFKKNIPSFFIESIKDFKLKKHDSTFYKKIEKLIIENQPDVIYERAYNLMSAGIQLSKKYNIPHIWEVNSPLLEEKIKMSGGSLYNSYSEKIEASNFKNTTLSVFVSTDLKDYYLRKYACIENKLLVTPNAINLDLVNVNNNKAKAIREKYNLDGVELIIGFVGSIFPYHGVDLLIRAFHRLILEKYEANIILMIVGDGEVLAELRNLVDSLGINKHVVFTGNVHNKEVFNYMSLFSIAVMAKSNWYGSPVKIFEYGALKLPVLAPNVGPVREVMLSGVDGILVEPNEEDIYTRLKELVENDTLRKEIGEAFYQKIVTKHQWKHNAEKVLKRLKEIYS
ncbi:MAG: glycosyltransferase family 4 protein [Flavobacteriales bacterium]